MSGLKFDVAIVAYDGGETDTVSSRSPLPDRLALARALVPECEAEQGWQPVSTVPPVGTDVLACFRGQFQWVMFVARAGATRIFHQGYAAPTHWRPLPPTPSAEETHIVTPPEDEYESDDRAHDEDTPHG